MHAANTAKSYRKAMGNPCSVEHKVCYITARLSILLIAVASSNGYILRLPCKQTANFSIVHKDKVLERSVIATYDFLTEKECRVECLLNNQCKSINTEKYGDNKCELNNKTTEDVKDRVALVSRTGWSYMTTDYQNPWIGHNCVNRKPCREGILCTDTCECPGFHCHECTGKQIGLHCYEGLRDCSEIGRAGVTKSGVYNIHISPFQNLSVFCDMLTTEDGWIVIQRRVDATTDFQKDWNDYKHGFGDINGNYWMGLDKMNLLAGPGKGAKLRIDLKHNENPTQMFYAKYDVFEVGNEADKYPLNIGGYSGDAGDSLSNCEGHWGHGCSTGMKFSTKDNDNDNGAGNCAVDHKGGWWYRQCFIGNLNSLHFDDHTDPAAHSHMSWYSLHNAFGGIIYSEMKIKYN